MYNYLRTNCADKLMELYLEGKEISTDQAELLESQLNEEPFDLEARAKLLGFYCTVESLRSPQKRVLLRSTILWLIEHAPLESIAVDCVSMLDPLDEQDLFAEAERLWFDHYKANPENIDILLHLGLFYEGAGDLESALLVLKEARRIKGKDRVLDRKVRDYKAFFLRQKEWKRTLAPIYSRKYDFPTKTKE